MKNIYFTLLIVLFFACGKNHEKFTTQSYLITGKAFIKNRFDADSTALKPLADQDIFVRVANDPDENYLFKTSTDSDGNFTISHSTRPIVLYTKEEVSVADNITAGFYGSTQVTDNQASGVRIIAEYDISKQNGLFIGTYDEAGGLLPSATVHLYNSQELALLDNAAFAVSTITTDAFGAGFRLGLPAGTYYANATRVADTISYRRLSKAITINATGIVRDTLRLKRTTAVIVNGFYITVKDSLGGNIPGADVYLYHSEVLAASNDPNGSIDSFKTDNGGKISGGNLPAGIYFLNATKTVDTLRYQRLLKTITLPAAGFVTDTMVVRRTH